MPFYKIIIWVKNRNKPYQGIRQMDVYNIDIAYAMVKKKVEQAVRGSVVLKVELFMLPKKSEEVRKYIEKYSK